MHLDINTQVRRRENESGKLIHCTQWLAVEVVSSAALSEDKAIKAAMRAPDWFLVKYEFNGMEEWLRLKEFNCNPKGSWHLDLDYVDARGASSSSSGGPSAQDESESSKSSCSESGSESEFEGEEEEEFDE